MAKRPDVPFLDLLEVYRHRRADEMRISEIDEHPTPAAHTLAAVAIARFLRREKLVPPSSLE